MCLLPPRPTTPHPRVCNHAAPPAPPQENPSEDASSDWLLSLVVALLASVVFSEPVSMGVKKVAGPFVATYLVRVDWDKFRQAFQQAEEEEEAPDAADDPANEQNSGSMAMQANHDEADRSARERSVKPGHRVEAQEDPWAESDSEGEPATAEPGGEAMADYNASDGAEGAAETKESMQGEWRCACGEQYELATRRRHLRQCRLFHLSWTSAFAALRNRLQTTAMAVGGDSGGMACIRRAVSELRELVVPQLPAGEVLEDGMLVATLIDSRGGPALALERLTHGTRLTGMAAALTAAEYRDEMRFVARVVDFPPI